MEGRGRGFCDEAALGCLILQCQVTLSGGLKKNTLKRLSLFITSVGLEGGLARSLDKLLPLHMNACMKTLLTSRPATVNSTNKQLRKSRLVQEPAVSPSQLGLFKTPLRTTKKNTLQSKFPTFEMRIGELVR